jgi:hypothetical protein
MHKFLSIESTPIHALKFISPNQTRLIFDALLGQIGAPLRKKVTVTCQKSLQAKSFKQSSILLHGFITKGEPPMKSLKTLAVLAVTIGSLNAHALAVEVAVIGASVEVAVIGVRVAVAGTTPAETNEIKAFISSGEANAQPGSFAQKYATGAREAGITGENDREVVMNFSDALKAEMAKSLKQELNK